MFARHFIDSLDFAHRSGELSGEIPVAEMSRMQDVLAPPDGRISYVLRGYQDKDGNPMLELTLDGMCQLRCQRCMGAMEYPVRLVTRLLLTDEETEDDGRDDVDAIPPDLHLDVSSLVEDEVLLSLPFAPMHETGTCRAATQDTVQAGSNPFAVLRGLKSG
jgi:DUF177 domain-containing protein